MQRKFSFSIDYRKLLSLKEVMEKAIQEVIPSNDDERLLIAGVDEMRVLFNKKLADERNEYKIKLTPVQAITMRILYTQCINECTTATGALLLTLSNSIHQKFSV